MGKRFDFSSGVSEVDETVRGFFLHLFVGDGEGLAWLDAWLISTLG